MDEEEPSPRGSPQGHRRRATNVSRNKVLYEENDSRRMASPSDKTRDRENGPVNIDHQNHDAPRHVSSGVPSDGLGDMNGAHVTSGMVRGYSSGRSDSFSRGMRPTYGGYQLRRHGSSESMSSQSTLVNRTGYDAEDDPQQSITDLIGMGQSGLTRSRINAHMRSEARKHRHSYHGGRGVGGVGGVSGGGDSSMDDHGGGNGRERVRYYQRLHPELQYPYEKMEKDKPGSSRRRREVLGTNTPEDDDEGSYSVMYMI